MDIKSDGTWWISTDASSSIPSICASDPTRPVLRESPYSRVQSLKSRGLFADRANIPAGDKRKREKGHKRRGYKRRGSTRRSCKREEVTREEVQDKRLQERRIYKRRGCKREEFISGEVIREEIVREKRL